MTFIGTSVIAVLSVFAAAFLILGSEAYLAGCFFLAVGIFALVCMFKLASDVDKKL